MTTQSIELDAYRPLPVTFGSKLLASALHLGDSAITHNRDVDAEVLRKWLVAHKPSLAEYEEKRLNCEFVEHLKNAVRLTEDALSYFPAS